MFDPRDTFHIMCCWMRKMRVQRTSEHDPVSNHGSSSVFHRPIEYGRPNYIGEYTREPGFEPYMQQGCCIQRLFDTLANHRTHNTRPHCHFDWRMGIGCTMAAERWVWTNEKPIFTYVEISALLTYWHGEFARKQISLRNDQQKTAASARAVNVLIMHAWLSHVEMYIFILQYFTASWYFYPRSQIIYQLYTCVSSFQFVIASNISFCMKNYEVENHFWSFERECRKCYRLIY